MVYVLAAFTLPALGFVLVWILFAISMAAAFKVLGEQIGITFKKNDRTRKANNNANYEIARSQGRRPPRIVGPSRRDNDLVVFCTTVRF